jgi:hypothetical protein
MINLSRAYHSSQCPQENWQGIFFVPSFPKPFAVVFEASCRICDINKRVMSDAIGLGRNKVDPLSLMYLAVLNLWGGTCEVTCGTSRAGVRPSFLRALEYQSEHFEGMNF